MRLLEDVAPQGTLACLFGFFFNCFRVVGLTYQPDSLGQLERYEVDR